jgi:hypothetical protein
MQTRLLDGTLCATHYSHIVLSRRPNKKLGHREFYHCRPSDALAEKDIAMSCIDICDNQCGICNFCNQLVLKNAKELQAQVSLRVN